MSELKQFKKIKNLLIFFVFFYTLFILLLNWNDISWIFNYKILSNYLANTFNVENTRNPSISAKEPDSLFIPKIGVQAPLIFSPTSSPEDIRATLKKGVLHYPDSALPSEEGETIILGHTAPDNWPKINYYHVFNRLNELEKGDEIFIYFQNKEYRYQVTKKFFVPEGAKVDYVPLTNSKFMVILLSCWPPNKGDQRIIVQAE